MAISSCSCSSFSFLFSCLLMLLLSYFCVSQAQDSPPIAEGLSLSFYDSSCSNLESTVRNQLVEEFNQDIGQAAGLLRLHFHDCFVQGCDASVLLDGSASGPGEQDAPPNLSLRETAFEIIDKIHSQVNEQCGAIVSCADIVALSARDSIVLSGGPDYKVPLGRRDGLNFATRDATLANLPRPSSNASVILSALANKSLDATDSVALSGGHTIGMSHCISFTDRLYPQDPTMDEAFANDLKNTCPENSTIDGTTVQDIRTPDEFDNQYYVDLVNRQGLFTSDQDLFTDNRTRDIVTSFADNQTLFFEKFVNAMIKMGQMEVVTGTNGEIRANCSVRNSDSTLLLSSVVDVEEELQVFN
ncbi:peroxidase 12-like [Apium graveolens]|uniref:peroxidase 12-like n=1 Tax=Apium graveolens TaxID=4045 RepID=UPI003D7BA24A